VAGDQQSALFGQACFKAGMAKNTYGTGCFMLMHTGGAVPAFAQRPAVTSAAQTTRKPQYAIEGSVFVGGAVVQWLRDGLKAIKGSAEVQSLAESVPDSGGVMMVPAFTGLGAPYWDPMRAAPSPASRAAPRWPTSRAPRSKASPTRVPRCCRP
jgi:glycerol kinase